MRSDYKYKGKYQFNYEDDTMKRKWKDIHGQKFGDLMATEFLYTEKTSYGNLKDWWKCVYQCGNVRKVTKNELLRKDSSKVQSNNNLPNRNVLFTYLNSLIYTDVNFLILTLDGWGKGKFFKKKK